MTTRKPAVAGTFYADTAAELEKQIEWCYRHELGPGVTPRVNHQGKREILAIIVPHAGYYYSGPVAAHAYRALADDGIVDTAVVLGPNHTGYGYPVSLWASGSWNTPLGEVEINEELSQRLLGKVIKPDETAHIHEHSIEVQLPWLQHLYRKVKIVPITMLAQDLETARMVGKAISQARDNLVIIASSDFTHYEPHSVAMRKDESVIEAIVDLDEGKLYECLERLHCTMCGYGPVASAIVAAKEMEAKTASLLKYATSGETSGDFSRVVGYSAIVIKL
ncbi:MAG: AmmeMemoRadiSam system protein B [Dehalococcoidia bacterium]